ncbi:MAG: hypothetical protein JNL58_11015 [Planctomyces sp.]|nr:hypothetical protein [Planctomyces sp.]
MLSVPTTGDSVIAISQFSRVYLLGYPSISRHRIVGHTDVTLNDRDCPGLAFDWTLLEREGLGMVPRSGSVSLDVAYGMFFRLEPKGKLQLGDNVDIVTAEYIKRVRP